MTGYIDATKANMTIRFENPFEPWGRGPNGNPLVYTFEGVFWEESAGLSTVGEYPTTLGVVRRSGAGRLGCQRLSWAMGMVGVVVVLTAF